MAKRGRGRPTKLSPAVEEAILKSLKIGAPLTIAAEAAGISQRTLEFWLEWGRAGKEPYASFADKAAKLRAEDAVRSLSVVVRAQLRGDLNALRAAIWSLERKFPRHFGQAAMHAAVSVHTGSAKDGDEAPKVQFYLPLNGRLPFENDGN